MKYFQEWSSAFTPWFTKDESGSTILYALKLCKFVIRKASHSFDSNAWPLCLSVIGSHSIDG